MFQGWENFYILIGSASGALIGLLFVVVTLTAGAMDRERALTGSSLYMTPTVALFTTVLVIGAIATAPGLNSGVEGGLDDLIAVAGLAYGVRVSVAIIKRMQANAHWTDVWCYGVFVAASYGGLAVASALTWIAPARAPYAIGCVSVAMLLLGVRNAWDLVTWIAPKGGLPTTPETEAKS